MAIKNFHRYRNYIIAFVDDRYQICFGKTFDRNGNNDYMWEATSIEDAKRLIDDYWNQQEVSESMTTKINGKDIDLEYNDNDQLVSADDEKEDEEELDVLSEGELSEFDYEPEDVELDEEPEEEDDDDLPPYYTEEEIAEIQSQNQYPNIPLDDSDDGYDYSTYPKKPNLLNLIDWYMDQGMTEEEATYCARADLPDFDAYIDEESVETEATNVGNIGQHKVCTVGDSKLKKKSKREENETCETCNENKSGIIVKRDRKKTTESNKNKKRIHHKSMYGGKYELFTVVNKYQHGGGVYVGLWDEEEGPFADLTVNLTTNTAKGNMAYLDTDNFPEGEYIVKKYKLGKFTGIYGYSGYCTYPLYELDIDEIKKYSN